MYTETAPRIGLTPKRLVAAVFLDEVAARDAIADLKLAGFTAADIGVCTAAGGGHKDPHPAGKHSLRWRLRHSFEADLQTQSPGIGTSAEREERVGADPMPYTELDLGEAMRAQGIPEETIGLMDREIGPDGLLIYVAAGHDREHEVESILEKDRGILRSSMATKPVI